MATILLVALAAACAAIAQAVVDPATDSRAVPPDVVPLEAASPKPARSNALVTVVDGDTHERIRGARVVIGKRADYANRRGLAAVRLKRPAALEVRVSKPGYGARTVRMPLQRKQRVTVRIYRTALQWTMFGANPRRTSAHTGIELRPPFKTVWSRGVGSLIEFPAVVSEGVAFIGNFKGEIYAIEMRRGRVVWRYDPPGGKMASSPAVVGRDVVVHGMDGIVRVLDRRNGRLRWQFDVGSPIESSPVVVNGLDYFGAWNGRVYALDLKRRKLRWTHSSGAKVTSSAAIAKGTLYIGNYAGRLIALSAKSGAVRFTQSVNGRIYGTPAVAKGRVFVPSSTGGSMTAFTTSGRYLWRVNTGSYVYSSPAVWGGRVFFGSYNGLLYAVSAATGAVAWTVGAGGPVSGAAVVVAGVAYAGSTYGSITGADARSGKVLLRFPHGEYVPVSGNGGRLLLHGYSRLYAVEPVGR